VARITINGITFDPESDQPVLAAARPMAEDASMSNYILIQTHAPLSREQRQELESKGVRILEYVPENTYLAGYVPTDLRGIRTLPYVAWANVYMQGFKLAPSLAEGAPGPAMKTIAEMAVQPMRTPAKNPKTVDVVFHSDVDPAAVRDKLAAAARLDPRDLQLGRKKVRLTVQEQYLPDLASIDEIRHVEEAPVYKLHNNIARQILRLEPPAGGSPARFEGSGQIVAVADTGFDMGSTSDTHPAFTGRVARLYPLGRPDRANDPDGHGTHVAGSVLGDGTSATLGIRIAGAAPKASLVFQSVLDRFGGLSGLPSDLFDLFGPPYQDDGARIHTNSWGNVNGDGTYNANSRELDDFVWNHRDCVILFSAGNEGTDRNGDGQVDPSSVTPPGTAKNCITVGATENNRPTFSMTYGGSWPIDFPAEPIASDLVANNPDGMVAFSGRGPARTQRIKPDVVAPGTAILSSRSRATSSNGWGLTADPLYFFEGGTSMATPLVAGCAAVVREFLITARQIANPGAALVKAVLINGATNISGQYAPSEAGAVPNNSEGFGRVDMRASIGPFGPNETVTLREEATTLDTGDQETFQVDVTTQHRLLKVTLVWIDPAGETLQNDLDLSVTAATGETRRGNVPPGSTSFDRVNNVEQVTWTDPPAGRATITVRAFRITQFAQSYALVIRLA
jgi:hypothetical protein